MVARSFQQSRPFTPLVRSAPVAAPLVRPVAVSAPVVQPPRPPPVVSAPAVQPPRPAAIAVGYQVGMKSLAPPTSQPFTVSPIERPPAGSLRTGIGPTLPVVAAPVAPPVAATFVPSPSGYSSGGSSTISTGSPPPPSQPGSPPVTDGSPPSPLGSSRVSTMALIAGGLAVLFVLPLLAAKLARS